MISYLNKVFNANFYDRHGRARRTDDPIASIISHFRSRTIAVGSKIPKGPQKYQFWLKNSKIQDFSLRTLPLRWRKTDQKWTSWFFDTLKYLPFFVIYSHLKWKLWFRAEPEKSKKSEKLKNGFKKCEITSSFIRLKIQSFNSTL